MRCKLGFFCATISGSGLPGFTVSGSTEYPDSNGTYCPTGNDYYNRPTYEGPNGFFLYFFEDNVNELSGWVIGSTITDYEPDGAWLYIQYVDDFEPPKGLYDGYFAAESVTVSESNDC